MYDGDMEAKCEAVEQRTPLLSERLQRKKDELEMKLRDINAAIETLNKNPGVEQTINAITKALGRL